MGVLAVFHQDCPVDRGNRLEMSRRKFKVYHGTRAGTTGRREGADRTIPGRDMDRPRSDGYNPSGGPSRQSE